MADYSPNPSSPAQYLEVEAQNSPINQYLKAAQEQSQIAAAGQAYQKNSLALRYAPEDLYNQAMQSSTQAIQGMKPLETGLMDQYLRRIAQPVTNATDEMRARMEAATGRQSQVPGFQAQGQNPSLNPMDQQYPNRAAQTVNQALPPGRQIQVPPEGGLNSIVMPQIAQQIAQQRAMGAAPQMPVQQMQIGPQQMMAPTVVSSDSATLGQERGQPPPFGYAPNPSGLNMSDPMVVKKFAQGVDPNQLLSTAFEKTFPPTTSAMGMSMRMLPSAMAGMANNQNTTATGLQEKLNALEELKAHNTNQDQLNWIKEQETIINDSMKAFAGITEAGTKASKVGRGAQDKSAQEAAARDQKMIDEVDKSYDAAAKTYFATDPEAKMGPVNAYKMAETDVARRHLWVKYANLLQQNGLPPPAAMNGMKPSKASPINQAPAKTPGFNPDSYMEK